MTKRTINFLILFILGVLCLTSSIVSFYKDINIELSKAKYVIGKVIYADSREVRNFSIRWTTYKHVYYFKLDNSKEDFAIHRSYERYEDLKSKIQIGDTLKVYYRPTIADYNTNVFQVEKRNIILEDYKVYKKTASSSGGLLLFIGLILTIASVLWYRRFNLLNFMKRLVEG